jgi:tetratricopeptide (TPR) repeat protein
MSRPRARKAKQPAREDEPAKPPALPWQRVAGLSLLLAVLTFVLYSPVGQHGFVDYDDGQYVVDNSHVQAGLTWAGLRWALVTGHASNWHPLTWLSHMLDAEWSGERPGGHHLTSVVLHALDAALLLVLLVRMTGVLWRSAFVAAAFAWHPLHVESVAWVSERKDVLSTLFGLCSLLAYVAYVRRARERMPGAAPDGPFRTGSYWLSLGCFTLGLMSKPMLVTWPFLMLLLDWWPLERFTLDDARARLPRLIAEKLPFFALSLASCVVTFVFQVKGGAVSPLSRYPLPERLANALVSYARYVGKALWPADLSVMYPNPRQWLAWQVILAALFLLVVSFATLRRRRTQPFLAVGWFWFSGTLVPVIGLVQVGIQAMADRYTYVPLIGLTMAVAWGAGAIVERRAALRWPVAVAGIAALAAWIPLTRHQIGFWKDSETLFGRAIAVTRDNYLALNNLGFYLSKQGRIGEAMDMYRAALAIDPSYADAHNNLGHALEQRKAFGEALEHYYAALRLDPELVEAHNNLGNALSETGKVDEAIEEYRIVLEREPEHPEAHNNLGIALAHKGRLEEAVEHFRDALRFRARYAGAHSNLGNAYAAMRRFDEAIAEYRLALEITPTDAQAHNNLGNALVEKGRLEEGVGQYREALRLMAENPEAHFNLAHALVLLGRREEAIGHLTETLRLQPDHAGARMQLSSLGGAPKR